MRRHRAAGVAIVCSLLVVIALVGCSSFDATDAVTTSAATSSTSATTSGSSFKVTLVSDLAGVSDRSFNELCWKGLVSFGLETGASVDYLQPANASEFEGNLDKAAGLGSDLVWGAGYAMSGSIEAAARSNPDSRFALIDGSFENCPSNLTGVTFRAQEPAFLVGYIAAMTTSTDKVGFVGGIQSDVIDQFEWGYKAGVAYGAKESGRPVEVVTQYVGSYSDQAGGYQAAAQMYVDGCDVVFHAAGNSGLGVIQAAVDSGKLVIGVDNDQYDVAPDNVLTSALKRVDKAVIQVSNGVLDGTVTGGTNIELGMKEDCAGISDEHSLMADSTYTSALKLGEQIKEGTLVPPANADDYQTFVAGL